jgi:hypothetical protein
MALLISVLSLSYSFVKFVSPAGPLLLWWTWIQLLEIFVLGEHALADEQIHGGFQVCRTQHVASEQVLG